MSFGRILLLMAVCVLIGVPLVGYIWETINQALALRFDTTRLALTIPAVVVFGLFLRFAAGQIRAIGAESTGEGATPDR